MKKKYIQPNVSVSFVGVESQLLGQSNKNNEGIDEGPGGIGGGLSKKHDFSSWDYGFDEEDNSESNSRRKSLWD